MKNKSEKITNWLLNDTLIQIKNQDKKNEALKAKKQHILDEHDKIKGEMNKSKFNKCKKHELVIIKEENLVRIFDNPHSIKEITYKCLQCGKITKKRYW